MTTATPPTGVRVVFESDGLTLVGDRYHPPGERGTVVLLHGAGQTRHSWTRTAHDLAHAGWSAITVDARGHGDSMWSPTGDYTFDAFAEDVAHISATLDQQPVLVGASLGGIASLLAVGEFRVAARGLVLVDIAPRVEDRGVQRIRRFMTGAPEGFSTLEEVAAAVAAYNPDRRRTATPEGLRKNVRQGADGRWRWHWDPEFMNASEERARDLFRSRLVDAAAHIEVPTMLARGDRSDVVSVTGVRELLDASPSISEVVVPGAGHMIAGDDNRVFGAELLRFLAQL